MGEFAGQAPPELLAEVGRRSGRVAEAPRLHAALKDAGFDDIKIERSHVDRTYPSAEAWWDWFRSGGAARLRRVAAGGGAGGVPRPRARAARAARASTSARAASSRCWPSRAPPRARGSGRGPRRAGRGTGGGRRRAPRRCLLDRRTRAAARPGCPGPARRRGTSRARAATPPTAPAPPAPPGSARPSSPAPARWISGSQSCRNVSASASAADRERAALGIDLEERGGLLPAERGEALPDLGQVARDQQQVVHGVDARGRLRGDDAAVAVGDHDGRLVARGQDLPHRGDILGQSRTRLRSPSRRSWAARAPRWRRPARPAARRSGATTTGRPSRTPHARTRPASGPPAVSRLAQLRPDHLARAGVLLEPERAAGRPALVVELHPHAPV